MKLRPLLSILSSTRDAQSPTPPPSKLIALSDSSTNISDATTTLQQLSPGTLTLSVSVKPLPVSHLKFLALHNHLLYAATGNLIHVIHTSSFAILDTFSVAGSSSGSVKSVAFSNGNVYTAHQDNKIRVWKLTKNKRHKRIATLPTLEDRLLNSVLPKNYVNVRRHRKNLWIQHNDAVSGLAFITDQLMCSASWDKHLKIWRTSDLRCVESIKAHDDAINAVIVSPDGTIYTGSADCRIKVWGKVMKKYGLMATLEKHKSAVNALALNNDGLVLFSGGCDRAVLVWEREHGSNGMVLSEVLGGHSKAVFCLINVSNLLFSGSADRTVRVWRRGCEGRFYCFKVLDGYERPVRSLVADHCEFTSSSEVNYKSNLRVFSESPDGVIRLITIKGFNISGSMSVHVR